MGKSKARALKLKAVRYCLIDQALYWKDPLGVFLRCLDPQEAQKVIFDFHNGLCGGHHFWKTTAHKILRAGYYWPTLFADVCREIRACIKCQKFSGKTTAQITAIKAYSSFGTFSVVGVRLHWRNSSSLKRPTQVDPDCDRLLHQVDRSYPYQEYFSQSNYQLPGGYHS
jgi:hypothetical protein